jgi:DNA uptake protein ComE-like DNA-binding protein
MMMRCRHTFVSFRPEHARGVALIVVLWAVVLLSTILLNFAFMAKTHLRIASNYADSNVLHHLALAGVERAIAEIKADTETPDSLEETWADNEEEFFESPLGRGHFSLLRNAFGEEESLTYGIEDEAAKVNLLTATAEMLAALPGMDAYLLDALQDWQDTDFEAKPLGAETAYYEALDDSYSCKDAPLSTLDELLLVKGFDASVLLGEDLNRNGLLDLNEDDGDEKLPLDNADGVLDHGLLAFVTLYSTDKNVSTNVQQRVNVTSANEQQLTQGIPGLTSNEAKGIVAYRGKQKFEHVGDLLKVTEAQQQQQQGQQQNQQQKNNSPGGKKSANNPGSSRNQNTPPKPNQPNAQPSGQQNNQSAAVGKKIINAARLKQIIDYCSMTNDQTTAGRININTAPKQVLIALPGISDALADAIVQHRQAPGRPFSNIAELLDVPGMSENVFIPLSDLITVRSFQFRVRSEAAIEGMDARRTAIAVLDRSGDKVKTLYWNEY